MKRLLLLIPLMLVNACGSVAPNPDALRVIWSQVSTPHAAALADEADDLSVTTGIDMIEAVDAALDGDANGAAVCDTYDAKAKPHAARLASHGGDRSVLTGQNLIARMDAACRG